MLYLPGLTGGPAGDKKGTGQTDPVSRPGPCSYLVPVGPTGKASCFSTPGLFPDLRWGDNAALVTSIGSLSGSEEKQGLH